MSRMMALARRLRSRALAADGRGSAVTEFGLLLPVLAMLLMGAMDVGHTLYVRSTVEGAIQRAARDSGLESGTVTANQTVIDARVRSQLRDLGLADDDITISRRFFRTFAAASAANGEPFTDSNGNGDCDQGEPYEDHNLNNTHDADGADGGQGGARDTVVYTVAVNYDRMFPMHGLIGLPAQVSMESSTVMNNQPYAEQSSYAAMVVRNCPAT
ncbi:MAG: TadE/TadG family type IV pilus assembly protein [Allosphingosinicella sp.]